MPKEKGRAFIKSYDYPKSSSRPTLRLIQGHAIQIETPKGVFEISLNELDQGRFKIRRVDGTQLTVLPNCANEVSIEGQRT